MSCDFAVIWSLRLGALSQILLFETADLNLAIKSTLEGYSHTFLSNFEDRQPLSFNQECFPAQLLGCLQQFVREFWCSSETLTDECSPLCGHRSICPSALDLHAPFPASPGFSRLSVLFSFLSLCHAAHNEVCSGSQLASAPHGPGLESLASLQSGDHGGQGNLRVKWQEEPAS